MSSNQQTFEYQGQRRTLRECENCQKAGKPGVFIFFIDTGRKKQNGKPEWELREPISATESKIHEHVEGANKKRSGYGSPPAKDIDGVVLVKLTPDLKVNQDLIKASGWKANRLRDGAVQILQKTDGDYLVLVHEVA